MILGRVIGSTWGARCATSLAGRKLLRVRADDGGAEIVAVDELSAGIGDRVVVGVGSRVRDLTVGAAVPTKAVVLAIVDDVARAGE
ncbi:MAG: ethanolamine utilization protein EutN [Deltaproteobacteria bacterium]|nr:ethanolamine utilization protein EutN [Deltaproteobacteria bacterium]